MATSYDNNLLLHFIHSGTNGAVSQRVTTCTVNCHFTCVPFWPHATSTKLLTINLSFNAQYTPPAAYSSSPCSAQHIPSLSRLTLSANCGSGHHGCQYPAASSQFGNFHWKLYCLKASQAGQTDPGQEQFARRWRSRLWDSRWWGQGTNGQGGGWWYCSSVCRCYWPPPFDPSAVPDTTDAQQRQALVLHVATNLWWQGRTAVRSTLTHVEEQYIITCMPA